MTGTDGAVASSERFRYQGCTSKRPWRKPRPLQSGRQDLNLRPPVPKAFGTPPSNRLTMRLARMKTPHQHLCSCGRSKVGATGFEPATTCTPYRCATKLRYAPICCCCACGQLSRRLSGRYQAALRPETACAAQPDYKPGSEGCQYAETTRRRKADASVAWGAHLYGVQVVAGGRRGQGMAAQRPCAVRMPAWRMGTRTGSSGTPGAPLPAVVPASTPRTTSVMTPQIRWLLVNSCVIAAGLSETDPAGERAA